MTKTELYNTLKIIENNLKDRMKNDNSFYKGVKYQFLAPSFFLMDCIYLELAYEERQEKNEFNNEIVDWLLYPRTVKTRDIIADRFKSKIKRKFTNHSLYPCPFDNAWQTIDELNYRKSKSTINLLQCQRLFTLTY